MICVSQICLQLISTPFHPAFLTPERIQRAKKLRLALTAGIGSDHVDLPSAAKAGITVAEITGMTIQSIQGRESKDSCLPSGKQAAELRAGIVCKIVILQHEAGNINQVMYANNS